MMSPAIVRTVLGDISANELGFTQPHEHLLSDVSLPLPSDATAEERDRDRHPITPETYYAVRRNHTSEDLRLQSVSDAAEELGRYAVLGGRSMVEATSIGIARDPRGLAAISRLTGINIVMGAGFYSYEYHDPQLAGRTESDIAKQIVGDIVSGVDDTGIRSGIIGEIGMSWPPNPVEETVLRAACAAQQETGAALLIHPGRDSQSPGHVMGITSDAGVDPSRVIMSHVERTLFSVDDLLRLADTGCYVEFDLFGQESSYYSLGPIDMPNDAQRVDYIIALNEKGFADRILISQDICHKTNLVKYGGEGYTHILDHVLPLMRRKGMTDSQIRTITMSNPQTVLGFDATATHE